MDYSGKKVLVMGLGLHGGGLQSALFLLKRGALLTVTDLRDEKILLPSIEQLDAACREAGRAPVRYVLGKHEIGDFQKADVVVKNPGVKPDSPFLKAAKCIETDISLFLSESKARLFAVTGSKGKSGTAAALHWILSKTKKSGRAFLGGNITISPLSFPDDLNENDDVVLELSSWQLGDLKGRYAIDGSPLLKPKAAVLTAIMPDHLDRYASMEEYVDDKRNIYRGQDGSCVTVAGDCRWGKSFLAETRGRPLVYSSSKLEDALEGGWIEEGKGMARLAGGQCEQIVPKHLLVPGEHQKINMLAAALAAYSLGADAREICGALSDFLGIEHRLELFFVKSGVRFYNDSAATIPEAAAACIEALSAQAPLVLVTGGTDKNLDFTPLAKAAGKAKAVILLAGSGSEKLIPLLKSAGISYSGPFNELEKALALVFDTVKRGDIAALSPGCASFGMFLNEFDRGKKWKDAVLRLGRIFY
jgi:UDP-N-acetylmuramoylalanine--D-glutamate ligase